MLQQLPAAATAALAAGQTLRITYATGYTHRLCLEPPQPPPAGNTLKHLLREAKQRVPPVLSLLHDPLEAIEAAATASGAKGCAFCGGLGHRITDCPKLASYKSQQLSTVTRKDYLGGGGHGAEV